MASEHETICSPFCHMGEGQRMPINCLMMDSILTPERSAREIKTAGGFDLRIGTTSGFSHGRKDFTKTVFIPVDRYIKFPAPGVDPFGNAAGRIRTRARFNLRILGFALDIEHLGVAAAVPVDGQAFAAQVIGHEIGVADILRSGAEREVDGLAYGIVGVFLKSCLDADVPFRGYIMGNHENPTHLLRGSPENPG